MRIVLACLFLLAPHLAGAATFFVHFPASLRAEPATGRLVVLLVREGSSLRPGSSPVDGPFWSDPQPLFGRDVENLKPGEAAIIDDDATFFPVKPSELPPGNYTAQARLVVNRTTSNWRNSPGNLWSDPVKFTVGDEVGQKVMLLLRHRTAPRQAPRASGVEFFEVRSELLSAFAKSPVVLRAGVVFPRAQNPDREYPAIYEIPGFGGDHHAAVSVARRRAALNSDTPEARLARETFHIVLDPESPNGHTLFADSANNGPWGEALVKELIPALERKYRLVSRPEGRIVRGHSSGGWSTLWLVLNYPATFGAGWSSSPDPVDFRAFQTPDIYVWESMYTFPGEPQRDVPSYRRAGRERMSIRQENGGEEVLGPDNTSGQQWDSWFAVFGPRNERGNPAALFDPRTGAIDREVAARYAKYDIGALLRGDPARFAPLFKRRVRLVIGDQDNFYLEGAVQLLRADLARLGQGINGPGYITIVEGADHGSIAATDAFRAFPAQMLRHLEEAGIIEADANNGGNR